MSRAARITGDSGIYHVMIRGIDRRSIFEEDGDRVKFLQCLETVRELSRFTLYAYCLMGNHVHLLLGEGEEPLGLVMKRVGVRYASWFNRKYARTGHLFQDRFRSEPVDTDAYFVTVLRYIWRNPVDAGLCRRPADYPWGSRWWLGRGSGLVNDADLVRRTGVADLRTLDRPPDLLRPIPDPPIWGPTGLPDHGVAALVLDIAGTNDARAVSHFPRDEQRRIVGELHHRGVSARQVARVTGIPRSAADRWSR